MGNGRILLDLAHHLPCTAPFTPWRLSCYLAVQGLDVTLTSTAEVDGGGATLDAAFSGTPIFGAISGSNLTIRNIHLVNSYNSGRTGGAVTVNARGHFEMYSSTISGCSSPADGGGGKAPRCRRSPPQK